MGVHLATQYIAKYAAQAGNKPQASDFKISYQPQDYFTVNESTYQISVGNLIHIPYCLISSNNIPIQVYYLYTNGF